MKRVLCWLIMFTVLMAFPVEGRALFLQTQEQVKEAAAQPAEVSLAYPMQSYRLKYAGAKELGKTLEGLLAKGEGIAVNEKLNTIVVRAGETSLKRLTKLIQNIDTAPLQIQVEAKIIELKSGSGDTSNPSALGLNWKYTTPTNSNNYIQQLTTDTMTTGATSLGLFAQVMSGNVQAYLSALEKTVGYDLVAAPWITALNHEEAEILIGSKYGYKQTIVTETAALQEVKFLEVGTKLKFTPHINEEGYVIMEIYPSISEGQIVNELPQENTTETKNKVLVKDGQSIVIGGLTKNYSSQTEIGVPILSSLPLLGNLFRRTQLINEKREIMVLITPHIVTPEFLEQMAERARDLDSRRQEWAEEKAKLIH